MKRRQIATLVVTIAALVVVAHPAAAQSPFYFGGTVAADSADRGSMNLRTVPAAGGLVGWRFNDRWSIEFHLDRGFAEGDPHGRIGFFGTDTLEDVAREGIRGAGDLEIPATRSSRGCRINGTVGTAVPDDADDWDRSAGELTCGRSASAEPGGDHAGGWPYRRVAAPDRTRRRMVGRPGSCASGSTSALKASTAMASTHRCIRVSG